MTGRGRCPHGTSAPGVFVRRDNEAGIVAVVAALAVAAVSITASVTAKTGGQMTGREVATVGALTVAAQMVILAAAVLAQRRVRVCDACRRR